jgi:hypothetical protein
MDLTFRINEGWVIHYVNMFFFTAILFFELIFTIKDILHKAIKLIRDKVIKSIFTRRNRIANPMPNFTSNTQQDEERKSINQLGLPKS